MIVVLVGLLAGCEQQPSSGQIVGLDGSMFSATWVNITAMPTSTPAIQGGTSTGLTLGALIGIIIAAVLCILGLGAFCIVRYRKTRAEKIVRMNNLQSGLDERYGSKDISSPNMGGYVNPKSDGHNRARESRIDKTFGIQTQVRQEYTADEYYEYQHDRQKYPISRASPVYNQAITKTDVLPKHPAYIPGNHLKSPSSNTASPRFGNSC